MSNGPSTTKQTIEKKPGQVPQNRPVAHDLERVEEDMLQSIQRAVQDPARARPADILALQRAAGNRAVSHHIQAKLTVGPAHDSYEEEADRVADQVLSMPAPTARPASVERAQRQVEEEEVQTKALVQRQVEEEEVQTKPLVQRQVEEEEVQTKALMQRQVEEEEVQTKTLGLQTDASVQRKPEVIQRGKKGGGGGGGGKGKQTTYKERMAVREAAKARSEAAKKPEREAKKAAAEVRDTKLRAAADARASRQTALITSNDAAINASIRRVRTARKTDSSFNAGTNPGGATIPGGTGNAIAIDRGLASDGFSIQEVISRPLDTSFSGLVKVRIPDGDNQDILIHLQ
jgi:membrane protein involved in colicin uptake